MTLPSDTIAAQYALLFLSLGLFFGFLLVATLLVEWLVDSADWSEWFL